MIGSIPIRTDKGDKMNKITHLDKYILTPNISFYGGFIWNGEDIFLCDDHDEDKDYVFDVRQEIKNGILSTDLKREYATKKDKKIIEKSIMEVELEKGQLLVYVEGIGYTIPEHKMCEVEDAIEQFNVLRGEINDT